MRCMNCGWENPDGLQKCEKCNSPLEATPREQIQPQHEAQPEVNLKGTVSEVQAFADPAPTSKDDNSCPQCGYPLRDGMKHCPNCGHDLAPKITDVAVPVAKAQSRPNHNATVNPWANPIAGKTFILQPVAWDNEKSVPGELSFIGESVELNRDNTDAANNTITSKVQAEIVCEDGKWSIIDKSSQNTTFVYAGRKIELADGDVIMLGNRKFIFKAE